VDIFGGGGGWVCGGTNRPFTFSLSPAQIPVWALRVFSSASVRREEEIIRKCSGAKNSPSAAIADGAWADFEEIGRR
jgi:hypothetical protein